MNRPAVFVVAALVGGCADTPNEQATVTSAAGSIIAPQFSHEGLKPALLNLETLASSQIFGRVEYPIVDGEHLWLLDLAGDPYLHLLDRETGRIVRSLGPKGEGPGEFASVTGASAAIDGEGIWLFDGTPSRMTRYTADDLNGTTTETLQLPLQPRPRRVATVRHGFVAWLADSAAQFLLVDTAARRTSQYAGGLLGVDTVPMRARVLLSNSNALCVQPEGTRFGVTYIGAGRLDIRNIDGTDLRSAAVPFSSTGEWRTTESGNLTWARPYLYYVACAAGKRHVYALFAGTSTAGGPDDPTKGAPDEAGYVHVFDWNGNLTRVFALDSLATSIAVDPDEQHLYAVHRENGVVYSAELP